MFKQLLLTYLCPPMSIRSAPSAPAPVLQATTSSRPAHQSQTQSASAAPPPSALHLNTTPSSAHPTAAQATTSTTRSSAAKPPNPSASHAPPTSSRSSPESSCRLFSTAHRHSTAPTTWRSTSLSTGPSTPTATAARYTFSGTTASCPQCRWPTCPSPQTAGTISPSQTSALRRHSQPRSSSQSASPMQSTAASFWKLRAHSGSRQR